MAGFFSRASCAAAFESNTAGVHAPPPYKTTHFGLSSSTFVKLAETPPPSILCVPPPCVWSYAVLLFVSSAAWTVTNLRDELGDILAGDDGTLGDITLAGLGLGE